MLYPYSGELNRFAYDINSLDGEDGILNEICKRINLQNGTFICCGHDENLFFDTLYNKSWQVVFVKENSDLVKIYPKSRFFPNIDFLGFFPENDVFYLNLDENILKVLENGAKLPKILIISVDFAPKSIKNYRQITTNNRLVFYANKQFYDHF